MREAQQRKFIPSINRHKQTQQNGHALEEEGGRKCWLTLSPNKNVSTETLKSLTVKNRCLQCMIPIHCAVEHFTFKPICPCHGYNMKHHGGGSLPR